MRITLGNLAETGTRQVIIFEPDKILCNCYVSRRRIFKLFRWVCKFLLGWRYVDISSQQFGIVTDEEAEYGKETYEKGITPRE